MKSENGEMWPQGRKARRQQQLEEKGADFLLEPPEEHSPGNTLLFCPEKWAADFFFQSC